MHQEASLRQSNGIQRERERERELLSVVFALERFHHYLYGYTVTVRTLNT